MLEEENEVGRIAESNYRAPRKAGRGLGLSGSVLGPREDSEHVRAADVCHMDGVTWMGSCGGPGRLWLEHAACSQIRGPSLFL